MEDDFSSNVTLGDDIFSALNSSDTELIGDKKNNLISNNVNHSLAMSNTQPSLNFDFSQMPLLQDERNTIEEFLSFNNDKRNTDDRNVANTSGGEDNFLNILQDYPRIDLNGMNVDKPIDIVVGLPDNFVVKNFSGKSEEPTPTFSDNCLNLDSMFLEESGRMDGRDGNFKNMSDYENGSMRFDYLSDPQFDNVLKTDSNNLCKNDESSDIIKYGMNMADNLIYSKNRGMFVTPVEYSDNMDRLETNVLGAKNTEDLTSESLYKKYDYSKKNKENNLHYVRYQNCGDRSIKIWQCGICGKDFRHQYTLTRHLPTHTDERNYKCETCGKAFRQMSTLSQHRAIHSDARPYVCEFCRKTFNRVSTLISHKKTHSDYKPHQCTICGKAFHQKGNLRNHIFTHTNERPYKCEICNKGFNQMSNLMCHKAHTHSEKGMYPCVTCGQVFNKRFSLRTHEEFAHGIKYPNKEIRNGDDKRGMRVYEENDKCQTDLDNYLKSSQAASRSPLEKMKIMKSYNTEQDVVTEKGMCAGVVIDLIKTKAMESAVANGQTPFALLKPCTGIPVLVKVLNANGGTQHMLVPATAEDLKMAGKITVASNEDTTSVKAVQIKVPVVATVIQTFDPFGEMQIVVEPPGPELESQNNELQKALDKTNRMKVEPEIFCEPLESDEYTRHQEQDEITTLGIEEAKRLFHNKVERDLYDNVIDEEFRVTDNKMKNMVGNFIKGDCFVVEDQNHVTSTNDEEAEDYIDKLSSRSKDDIRNVTEVNISSVISKAIQST